MNQKPIVILALAASLFGGGVLVGRFSPASPVETRDAGGIFIPISQLTSDTPQDWKDGQARYIVTVKPGETMSGLCERVLKAPDSYTRFALICNLSGTLQKEDFPAAFDLLAQKGADIDYLTAIVLLSRWADLDPKAAWERLQNLPSSERSHFASTVFKRWLDLDESEALRQMAMVPEENQREKLLEARIRHLAEKDPLKAVQMIRANPKLADDQLWTGVIRNISARDPRKAIELTLALPEGAMRQNALDDVARRWCEGSPEDAWNWAVLLPEGKEQGSVITTLIHSIGDRDPERVADLLLKELPSKPNLIAFATLAATRLASANPERAFQWIDQLPTSDVQKDARFDSFQVWIRTNPEKALTYAIGHKDAIPSHALLSALTQWIIRDASAGIQWIKENPKELSEEQFNLVIRNLSANNAPEKALDLAAHLPLGSRQLETVFSLASAITKKDRAAAEAYLTILPEGPVLNHAKGGYILAIAEASPEEAARMVDQLPSGQFKGNIATDVAILWIKKDPIATIQWTQANGKLTDNPQLLGVLARRWSLSDFPAASNWVNQLPQGDARDTATSALSLEEASFSKPTEAIIRANTIQSEATRNSTLEQIASIWMASNPDAASAWVSQSPLSPEQKEKLLKRR